MGNQEFQGEEVRELLDLPSSCFTVQDLDGEIRFFMHGPRVMGWDSASITVQQMSLEGKKVRRNPFVLFS